MKVSTLFLSASLLLGAQACRVAPQTPDTISLAIPFAAVVGDQAFACGRSYPGLGTSATTYEPMELRFFVHDVRLVTIDGEVVSATIVDDGVFQNNGVALLDFADGAGLCSNGTLETNEQLIVEAPNEQYQALRFKVGVPFEQNHQDVAVAAAPLNDVGMFWGWQFGYLFARIEGRTTGLQQGHNFHLGSTNCIPNDDGSPGAKECTNENLFEVNLTGYDPERSEVVLDLAALFADSDLDFNTEQTAPGCMSFPGDPECTPIFDKIGITFDTGIVSGVQSIFRVEQCGRSRSGLTPIHCL